MRTMREVCDRPAGGAGRRMSLLSAGVRRAQDVNLNPVRTSHKITHVNL